MPVSSGIWLRDPPINSSRLSTLQPPSNFFFPHRSSGPLRRVTIVRMLRTAGSSDAIVFILFRESLGFCVDFDRSSLSKIELSSPSNLPGRDGAATVVVIRTANFISYPQIPSAGIRNGLFAVLSASCRPLRLGPCMSQVGSCDCRCASISYPRIRLSELPG